MNSTITRPTWDELTEEVGSEQWLAAIRLLQLSPQVRNDAGQWLGYDDDRPTIDWNEWIRDVDEQGRGWSSTERCLFQLVAALVDSERKVQIAGLLDWMGSWQRQVLEVLVEWASGGNNKDRIGSLRVVAVGAVAR